MAPNYFGAYIHSSNFIGMRKYFYLAVGICFFSSCISSRYQKVHQDAFFVDTHNDVLSTATMNGLNIEENLISKTHSDLDRMNRAGIDLQIFSIYCDDTYGNGTAYKRAIREIDSLTAIANRNPTRIKIIHSPSELSRHPKFMQAMMGVEGGHMIEDNLSNIDTFYNRGARYLTLTWNNSTSWATSAADESKGNLNGRKAGLNEFGEEVVKKMNKLGMMVDVSHVGEQTFWDVIRISTKPVIASHSSVYSLCPVPRNLKDDQIKAIAKNGGVIHINFNPGFIDKNYNKETHPARPPISMIIDHINYIVKLVGVDYVGIGSDFDGIDETPAEMDGVQDFPKLTKALLKAGYSKADVRKILGENFLRVYEKNAITSN